jgi:hypothetical protein
MSTEREAIDHKTPVDHLEPEDALSGFQNQIRAIDLLNRALATIVCSPNPEVAAWQVAYAIGSPICMGVTMTEKAQELETGTANISKGATRFCRSNNLPPSRYMLSETSRTSYQKLRKIQEKTRDDQ